MGLLPIVNIPIVILLSCTLAILMVGLGFIGSLQRKKDVICDSKGSGYHIKLK